MSIFYGTIRFSTHLEIRSDFIFFGLYFAFWLVPVLSVLAIGLWIISHLYKRSKRVIPSKVCVKKKTFFLARFIVKSSVVRFIIIISVYWVQWAPPCFMTVFTPLFSYNPVPKSVTKVVYWLTFTVCLADPLVVLILNPNVKFRKRKPKILR